LRDHHAELIKHHITVGGAGLTSEAPLAQQDPVFVGRLHNLGQACDQFINTMRNNFWSPMLKWKRSGRCLWRNSNATLPLAKSATPKMKSRLTQTCSERFVALHKPTVVK
jgi:hypothetical protein